MVSFKITVRGKRWYVVGEYAPPNGQPAVHWMDQALVRGPLRMGTLLVGYLSYCLVQPHNWSNDYLATAIANYSLEDQMLYFILQQIYRGEGG